MRLAAVRRAGPQSGIAILTVLLVLMALLALSAPFLMTTRNAAKASSQLADAAHARLALDSAARLARGELARSHPSVDPTPWSDSEDEIGAWTELDDAVLDAHDPLGVMWDASALDLAAQIDLASAPPQLFANVIGASTRLDAPLDESSTEIAGASSWPTASASRRPSRSSNAVSEPSPARAAPRRAARSRPVPPRRARR
jgi:hypothetical protein